MRVVFACVGNAGCSQIAQALYERAVGESRSGGTHPEAELHPHVVEAMLEWGIDLAGREPRQLTPEDVGWADLVVTIGCGDECPVVPATAYRDWPLPDPAGMSLAETRQVRDEIASRVAGLVVEFAVDRSGYGRAGFAERYDLYRPGPPEQIVDLLSLQVGVERPRLVVDLGSGTGLSAEVWSERADEVVGIEPNPAMRAVAEARAPDDVRYLGTHSAATGLPDSCADIVTCSQSLHWMVPEPTFAEIARVLRPGGVFAAYDYDVPPAIQADVDAAFARVVSLAGVTPDRVTGQHLMRMRASGRFRHTSEVFLHRIEEGGAERVVGIVLSFGSVALPLADGSETEASLGISALRDTAERVLGARSVPWFWSYRVRLGVK